MGGKKESVDGPMVFFAIHFIDLILTHYFLAVGFPKFIYYGQEGPFSVMVIEMLGPSLEDLYNFCGRKMSLKTVLLLADQLLCRVQRLHEKGYIHRDLKPENMLMGLEDNANTLYLIDFGLAKKWKQSNG